MNSANVLTNSAKALTNSAHATTIGVNVFTIPTNISTDSTVKVQTGSTTTRKRTVTTISINNYE
jgi:hypothetical protein